MSVSRRDFLGAGAAAAASLAIPKLAGSMKWTNPKTLESNENGWYCYTAIHFAGEHVVLSHCADDLTKSKALSTTQITRFPVKWLYE